MKDKEYKQRIKEYATLTVSEFLKLTHLPSNGLNEEQVNKSRKMYGDNFLISKKNNKTLNLLLKSFLTPFSFILTFLALISLFTEILFPQTDHSSYYTVAIIFSMVFLSGIIRFSQEKKGRDSIKKVIKNINTKVWVYRCGKWEKKESNEIVRGDYIRLKKEDRVPCDMKIIKSSSLFISQSIITGESAIVEKNNASLPSLPPLITDYSNILFLGTTVTSGECEGVCIEVGKNTLYGNTLKENEERKKGFDKGANSISRVFIRFMLLLVPIVFIASSLTSHNYLTAFLFALSVAVGLVPELLPMVITTSLGRGSFKLRKKQTIVKNVNAMQGFGSMDTLCVDKTGTLTNDCLILEYYMDILGNEEKEVLNMAFLNSYYHSGIKDHVDLAILKIQENEKDKEYYNFLTSRYRFCKSLPFDYKKKCSSVVIEDIKNKKKLLITKGEVNSVIKKSNKVMFKDKKFQISENDKYGGKTLINELSEDGMKVLAIAIKEIENDENIKEEDLTLIGYIAFFDAPKKSSKSAILKLKALNVNVKVLTGDNRETSISICKRLGIDTKIVMSGKEFDALSDNEVQEKVENTSVFVELDPKQKAQIVSLLKGNGHKVGFLGDGMNDLNAITEADVGISVDTADVSVKEVADVVLLKKDLNVLEEGIIEGRKAFINMLKYIKITASSNLGNIFSIVISSLLLPFFPMTSLQILLLNLLYDVLCLALPWDNVDRNMYEKRCEWSGHKLSSFMLFFSPISVLFDLLTFTFLLFILCPLMCGSQFFSLDLQGREYYISIFQTGWFLESMYTQVLIIQLLRTKKLPFIQSKPSLSLVLVTIIGITTFTLLIYSPLKDNFGFTPLPLLYFVFLFVICLLYLFFMTISKRIYLKKRDSLL